MRKSQNSRRIYSRPEFCDFLISGLEYLGLHYEFGAFWTGFAAVDGGFGAPFLG